MKVVFVTNFNLDKMDARSIRMYTLINAAIRLGYDVSILNLVSIRKQCERWGNVQVPNVGDVKVRYLKTLSYSNSMKIAIDRAIVNAYLRKHSRHIYWFQTETTGFLCYKPNKPNFILDVAGLMYEEYKYLTGKDSKERYNRQHAAIEGFTKLSVVSEHMKRLFRSYREGEEKEIVVIPTMIDTSMFYYDRDLQANARKRLGFHESDVVFIFSGSSFQWHMPEKLVTLALAITAERNDVYFIILSNDKEQYETLLRLRSPYNSRIHVYSSDYSNVSYYLNAADCGVILRENILLNNVAAPTKIGEYLGCGLPIIMTEGIGDFSELLNENGIAKVIDLDFGKLDIKEIVSFVRQRKNSTEKNRIMNFAHHYFAIETYLKQIEAIMPDH